MNSHKTARLTYQGRKLLMERIAMMGLVSAAGISVRTARKWHRAGVDCKPSLAVVPKPGHC